MTRTDANTLLGTAGSGEGQFDAEVRFTAPDDGNVMVKMRYPAKAGVVCNVCNPQLELASTYDVAVSGGGGFASSPGTPCHETERPHRAGDAR